MRWAVLLNTPPAYACGADSSWGAQDACPPKSHVLALLPAERTEHTFCGQVAVRYAWQLRYIQSRSEFWFHLIEPGGHWSDWVYAYYSSPGESRGSLTVKAVAVARSEVDQAIASLREQGLRPEGIFVEGLVDDPTDPRAVLRAPTSANLISKKPRWPMPAVAAILACVLVLWWLPAAESVEAASIAAPLVPAIPVHERIQAWQSRANPIPNWPQTLTAVLPPDTVITHYTINSGGEWTLSGVAPSSTQINNLITALQQHHPLLLSNNHDGKAIHFEIRGHAP